MVEFEAEVAVCDDTYEMVVIIDYRNTTDMIFCHHIEGLTDCGSTADGHRVVDHTVFGTLHDCYLSCLFLNAHVLVDHADTTLSCDGDGHCRLCYGVHGSRNEWYVQIDVTRELGFQLYCAWQYF